VEHGRSVKPYRDNYLASVPGKESKSEETLGSSAVDPTLQ